MAKPGYSYQHFQRRKELLAGSPICVHCNLRVATRADHQPPLALHRHVEGSGCCRLVPSCLPCEHLQAGLLGGSQRLPEPAPLDPEPVGLAADDRVWRVPWLFELLDVPANATWPRLMTVPHPRAVGSLGAEVAVWAQERRGRPWRWWQRLVATRLLEVDVDGLLVWETMLLTVARQLGKSWLLHDLCSWRLEQGARFGSEQLVLSTGKDLGTAREMQRPARVRAKGLDGYKVREVNGQEEIEWLWDGSRWMVRAKEAVYGLSASFCTVDEAWKVLASAVDDGIVPTMVEQFQAQLLLVSTAHRRASSLMIGRRATALACLRDPGEDGFLLMEWSSPRDADLADRDAWRLASPHWSPRRERLIAQRLAAALAGESDDADEPDPVSSFRTQWRNEWPAKRLAGAKGDPVVEADVWAAVRCELDSVGPLVVGVEDTAGQGAAVGCCAVLPDGRFILGGVLCGSRAEAYAMARVALEAREGSTLVVGVSLHAEAAGLEMPGVLRKAGRMETGPALAMLRDLLATGRVVHDGSPALDEQVADARVTVGLAGLSLIPGGRTDLLRATVWALRTAVVVPSAEPAIH